MAENAGGIYYDIEMDVRGLLTSQQRVNQRLDLMERGFDKTSRSIDTTERSMSSLSRVAVALTAALSVQQVAEYADAWATVNNKLSNSLRPSEQLADVTERVFNITQQTRSSLDATASLYARLERATRQYGTSAGDLAKLTTIINQGFVVSGATAQEAENAIIQLSQGLASGALRGEEFNSVNEQGNGDVFSTSERIDFTLGDMWVVMTDSLGNYRGRWRAYPVSGKAKAFQAAADTFELNIYDRVNVQNPSRYFIATDSELNSTIWRVDSAKPNGDDTQTLSLTEYSDSIYP
jgi:tape measure domain-containing protein